MIKVKKKKDKIKRKRVGNVRTTERTKKRGGNVSQVVNVYVTKGGGGGRKKAPAQRPTFFQPQKQLFTANYDNKLLNQIQPIQDKFIKMFNTNNDLLNKLLTKQRTSDSSIQTDTLTNDKLFTKETQTAPEKIPVFRPADTQTEPIKFNTVLTQTEPIKNRVIETQTEPTFLTTTGTQSDAPIFNTTGTQSDTPLFQTIGTQAEPTFSTTTDTQTEPIIPRTRRIQTDTPIFNTTGTQSDTPLFQTIGTQAEPQPFKETKQINSDMELQEYLNYLTSVDSGDESDIDEKLMEALQTQITVLSNDLQDVEGEVLELGGNKRNEINESDPSKLVKALKKRIKLYKKDKKRLLIEEQQDRRDDDPAEYDELKELEELVEKDIAEERASGMRGAEEDPLISQLIEIKKRAKANKIGLIQGALPKKEEKIREQIKFYSEAIAIKNRAMSI